MVYGVKCSTDPFLPIVYINAYPCCRSHNMLVHQVLEWAFVIYWSVFYEDSTPRPRPARPALVSAATDSCRVELGAALYWMTPNSAAIKFGYVRLTVQPTVVARHEFIVLEISGQLLVSRTWRSRLPVLRCIYSRAAVRLARRA